MRLMVAESKKTTASQQSTDATVPALLTVDSTQPRSQHRYSNSVNSELINTELPRRSTAKKENVNQG